MKKNVIITVIIIVSFIGSVVFVLSKNKANNELKTNIAAATNASVIVRVDTVRREAVRMDFKVNGRFAPSQELTFSAEKAGRVVRVNVREGSRVEAGQVLATIRVDQLSVDLQNAQANYQNALSEKERFENVYATGGVTRQQLDQVRLNLENAQNRLKQAEINMNDASIRSSISGIVNKRYIEPGSVLSSGTAMFDIVNVFTLKLNVSVNEGQIALLHMGDKIVVKATVFPDKSYQGVITFIAPKADNALNFPVEIEISNGSGNELKAGMYGTAVFEFQDRQTAMIVSRDAFVGSVSSNQLFVMDTKGIARLTPVTPGRILGDKVELLSGIQEGDQVIVSGQINLKDGAKVSVMP